MKYVIPCRYNRFEDGKLVRYPAGSEVELSDREVRKLGATPVEHAPSPAEVSARQKAEAVQHLGTAHLPAETPGLVAPGVGFFRNSSAEAEGAIELAHVSYDSERPATDLDDLTRQQAIDVVTGLETVAEVEAALSSERGRSEPRQSVLRAGEERLAELS